MKSLTHQVAYTLAITKHENDGQRVMTIIYPLAIITGLILLLFTIAPVVREVWQFIALPLTVAGIIWVSFRFALRGGCNAK